MELLEQITAYRPWNEQERMDREELLRRLRSGEALEVSRQSVSKWETGASVPDLDRLIGMSDLFGVTLDELAGCSGQRS